MLTIYNAEIEIANVVSQTGAVRLRWSGQFCAFTHKICDVMLMTMAMNAGLTCPSHRIAV